MPDQKLFDHVENWTKERGPFTLRFGADAAPSDLTGKTITAVIRDKDGAYVTTGFEVRVDDDPTTGQVYLTFEDGALENALTPYRLRFKGVDGAGDVVDWPDDGAYRVDVHKP